MLKCTRRVQRAHGFTPPMLSGEAKIVTLAAGDGWRCSHFHLNIWCRTVGRQGAGAAASLATRGW